MIRTIISRRSLLATASALSLTACVRAPTLMIVPEAAETGIAETVFVASNRVFSDGQFQSARQEQIAYTRFTVEIPTDRDAGAVRPGRTRGNGPNLRTDFVASEGSHLGNSATFRRELIAEAQRRGTREVMIFIHGFASTVGTGLYRTAQIRYDFDVPGVPVHYAWPSSGSYVGYAYDRDSALFARDGLEDLITEIMAAGLDIVLVAHSLGSSVVMEVMRQLRIGGHDDVIDRINGVILFSPDMDVDVFRNQASRIGELPQPFVIFTSQRDRALTFSSIISGPGDRVGTLATADQVAEFEVTLIDVSAFEGGVRDRFNHFTGATSPSAVRILRDAAQINSAFEDGPTSQPGLLPGTILRIQNATLILIDPEVPR